MYSFSVTVDICMCVCSHKQVADAPIGCFRRAAAGVHWAKRRCMLVFVSDMRNYTVIESLMHKHCIVFECKNKESMYSVSNTERKKQVLQLWILNFLNFIFYVPTAGDVVVKAAFHHYGLSNLIATEPWQDSSRYSHNLSNVSSVFTCFFIPGLVLPSSEGKKSPDCSDCGLSVLIHANDTFYNMGPLRFLFYFYTWTESPPISFSQLF